MKYVNYILDAEEPIKMGNQGSQANSDALSYVAGSAIRGAVIAECVKTGMDVESLVKNTRFFDAYIVDGECHTLPVPFIYYADKHAIRENELRMQSNPESELPIRTCLEEVPKEGEQRVDVGDYGRFEQGGCLLSTRVRKIANLHIKVGNTPSEKAMYRYEAIAEYQSIGGAIACEDDETARMYRDLIDGRILYLGGSKGSGYGRCKVRKAEILSYEQYIAQFGIRRKQNDGTLVIYAMSNLLLNDSFGGVTGEIPTEYLEAKFGITDVTLQKSYVATGVSGGFNHTWRAGNVQRCFVKAGSVFVYSYRGRADEMALLALEENGVGMRRQDGFGRVLINPDLACKKRMISNPSKIVQTAPVAKEDLEVLALIGKEVNDARYRKMIEQAALKCADENRGLVASFTLSQISRMYGMLSELAAFDVSDDEIKERVGGFAKQIFKRTTVAGDEAARTTKTVSAFNTAKIQLPNENGKPIRLTMKEVLQDLSDNKEPWGAMSVHGVTLGEAGAAVEAESPLKTKVRLLCEIFYNLMRKEGGEKKR